MSDFESIVQSLTEPVNGQYPRPWMTATPHPEHARVFVVGRNQATGFPIATVASHSAYLDALFNRNGRSCRALYDQVRALEGKGPSPTRSNQDMLTAALEAEGVNDVIETNVICYSTPMSADLSRAEHRGGSQRGTEIFRTLLDAIRPAVLIAHGSGTHRDLARLLGHPLSDAPTFPADGVQQRLIRTELSSGPYEVTVMTLPSLAPPAYNRWSSWAPAHLRAVASAVRKELSG